MSVTNAVSGITAAGALHLMGGGYTPHNSAQAMALGACFVSSINIGGGFTITKRMLDMFKRPTDPPEYNYLYVIPGGVLLGTYALGAVNGFEQIHGIAALISSLCCVGAISGLSSQHSARLGNSLGMIGVSGAVLTTLGHLNPDPQTLVQMCVALTSGMTIGKIVASRIQASKKHQLSIMNLIVNLTGHRPAPTGCPLSQLRRHCGHRHLRGQLPARILPFHGRSPGNGCHQDVPLPRGIHRRCHIYGFSDGLRQIAG
jgi:hypothetical protein